MPNDDHDLRDRFSAITEVPLSDALKREILHRAQSAKTRRRRDWFRPILSAGAGVAAACVLIWCAWSYGADSGVATQELPVNAVAASHQPLAVEGLKIAPISVGIMQASEADVKQGTVRATLTNVGTDVLQPRDLVGLLAFQQGTHPDSLVGAQWATFVDPPNSPIQPGQTITWTFQPIGVPIDQSGHFQGEPKLVFLERGFVATANADITWKKAPLAIEHESTSLRTHWDKGTSFSVDADLRNNGSAGVDLQQVMAIVWFSKSASEDWTQPGAVRFMSRLADGNMPVELAPGASTQVHLHLIGPENLDLSGTPVHVLLIWR